MNNVTKILKCRAVEFGCFAWVLIPSLPVMIDSFVRKRRNSEYEHLLCGIYLLLI